MLCYVLTQVIYISTIAANEIRGSFLYLPLHDVITCANEESFLLKYLYFGVEEDQVLLEILQTLCLEVMNLHSFYVVVEFGGSPLSSET